MKKKRISWLAIICFVLGIINIYGGDVILIFLDICNRGKDLEFALKLYLFPSSLMSFFIGMIGKERIKEKFDEFTGENLIDYGIILSFVGILRLLGIIS